MKQWKNYFRKDEKKKPSVIFNREEKLKFIETLLVVGSILTGFTSIRPEFPFLLIPSFIMFIVCSLIFIVWISFQDKIQWEKKLKHQFFNRIFIIFLSGLISVSFSSVIASIYILSIKLNGVYALVGFFGLYISITAFLWIALSGEKQCYESVDVVD